MTDLNAEKFCCLLAKILKEQEMSDWIEVDLELMWNLLPQSVLRGLSNGEATYYLTLVSSAANMTKLGFSSQPSLWPGLDSADAAVPTDAPHSASLKSGSSTTSGGGTTYVLTVYIPNNESSNLVTKNVPLRNDAAKVKDVCALLVHLLSTSNPTDHALFSIVDGQGSHFSDFFGPRRNRFVKLWFIFQNQL